MEDAWKSINSAPKDGTQILVLYHKGNGTRFGENGNFITQAYWKWCRIFTQTASGTTWVESTTIGEWYDYTNRLIQLVPGNSKNNVTHWMPLPEPPK